jgi:hypothetical protein
MSHYFMLAMKWLIKRVLANHKEGKTAQEAPLLGSGSICSGFRLFSGVVNPSSLGSSVGPVAYFLHWELIEDSVHRVLILVWGF